MSRAETLSARTVRGWLPRRAENSHKGDYGHVLIAAGSRGMSGAAILSGWGALRGGAGLVTAAVPESQQPVVAGKIRPEAMTLALPETAEGSFSEKAAAILLEKIRARKITAVAAGPGLGRSPQAARFVVKLLSGLKRSPGSVRCAVLDADGFLALKAGKGKIGAPGLPVIVTPHPGELAAFLGISVARVQSRRLEIAREFAKLYAVVCVLKGHATVVADGRRAFVNPTGNPGMATGGSGDVLTGLIAALSGQVSGGALETAAAGTFLHGLAGDFAARAKTQEGMLAGDIAEFLPQALRKVFGKK